jgi:ribosomal protein L5
MNEVKITMKGEEAMHFLERLARIEEDLAECVEFIQELKKDQTSQSRKSSPKTV